MDSLDLKLFLRIGSGVFWILVYLIIIIKGFKDKTYGMPVIALGANISWEFIYSFIYPHEIVQNIINILWFLFDVIIFYQVLKYGKSDNSKISKNKFIVFGITILCFFSVFTIAIEFNDMQGKYSAFPQNLLMSILFIVMLNRRNNILGQSIYIAVFKLIGTLFASVLFFIYYPSVFISYMSISIFIFDWIYIISLYKFYRRDKISLLKL